MTGHRAGERILGVGVYVHLDHAVRDGLGDLLGSGAGAAVEHEFERLAVGHVGIEHGIEFARLRRIPHALLNLVEQFGAQFHHAGLVRAVHIAEREGGHVFAALTQTESVSHGHAVGNARIQLLVDLGGVAVLLAAHRADLDLEHGVGESGLLEQLLGDVQILLERHRGTVPHMRLEHRLAAVLHLVDLDVEQRIHPFVEILLGTVVGVQRYRASEPVTRLFTRWPEKYAAPPTDT